MKYVVTFIRHEKFKSFGYCLRINQEALNILEHMSNIEILSIK